MVLSQRQAERIRVRGQLPLVFTPAAPVARGELFAGRQAQIGRVLDAVGAPGQHVILFGERGVGKTSLASLIHYFWNVVYRDPDLISPWAICDTKDTFGTIWAKVVEKVVEAYESRGIGIPEASDPVAAPMEELTAGAATPSTVSRFLQLANRHFVIIIDEFDRIEDDEARTLMADTIKTLSDYAQPATLVIVGVADTVSDLIREHESIDRALEQVQMPRMSQAELQEIITKGCSRLGLRARKSALATIARLSQGLPHYTHLLARSAAIHAVDDGRLTVMDADVRAAVGAAVDGAIESVRTAYHAATSSNRPGSLYKQVLLACALAEVDDRGYFAPADVSRPMSHIMGKPYDVPAFARHLNDFCDADRASVLNRIGVPRRQRFRFSDPLLMPYVIFRGLTDGMIEPSYLFSE